MNAYLTSVIENVKKKHGNEPEFVQTVASQVFEVPVERILRDGAL